MLINWYLIKYLTTILVVQLKVSRANDIKIDRGWYLNADVFYNLQCNNDGSVINFGFFCSCKNSSPVFYELAPGIHCSSLKDIQRREGDISRTYCILIVTVKKYICPKIVSLPLLNKFNF